MGLNANLMSLAGIAISIGVLVDGAIVEVENAYNKIHQLAGRRAQGRLPPRAPGGAARGGPGVFFSLLVIAVAFLPVFTLVDQEGRLFRPLAYSKNLAMAIAALLAITLDPAMRMLFARIEPFRFRPRSARLARDAGRWSARYHSEERHPISRLLHRVYEGPCRFVAAPRPGDDRWPAVLIVASTVPVYLELGSEFMPPLRRGHASSTCRRRSSRACRSPRRRRRCSCRTSCSRTFPEVERVFGKAGPRRHLDRSGAALDDGDHGGAQARARSGASSRAGTRAGRRAGSRPVLRPVWRDRISEDELRRRDGRGAAAPRHHQRLDHADQGPARHAVDRHPHAGRHQDRPAPTCEEIEKVAVEIEAALRKVPGTRSVYAERVAGGYFLDFVLKRDQLARYGLSDRRRQRDGHDRGRRRGADRHRRGPRALRHQRALRPRLPRGPRGAAPGAAAAAPAAGRSRWRRSPTWAWCRGRR